MLFSVNKEAYFDFRTIAFEGVEGEFGCQMRGGDDDYVLVNVMKGGERVAGYYVSYKWNERTERFAPHIAPDTGSCLLEAGVNLQAVISAAHVTSARAIGCSVAELGHPVPFVISRDEAARR